MIQLTLITIIGQSHSIFPQIRTLLLKTLDVESMADVEQVGGALIYYLQRSDPKDPEYDSGLLAFPEGFRMLARDPMLRSFSDTLEQRAISFACLGTDTKETNEIPNINCPNGLRAQVFFPSCWDGKNLDSADHKSHMAYPTLRFISLFYEVVWDTNKYADKYPDGKHPFVFSNGDETGYGYHGDFVNGWDVATLQKAVIECTNLSGVVENCPVFQFFEDEKVDSCKIEPAISETIQGTLAALPGCSGTPIPEANGGNGSESDNVKFYLLDRETQRVKMERWCKLKPASQYHTMDREGQKRHVEKHTTRINGRKWSYQSNCNESDISSFAFNIEVNHSLLEKPLGTYKNFPEVHFTIFAEATITGADIHCKVTDPEEAGRRLIGRINEGGLISIMSRVYEEQNELSF
ncbi:hypothetical protein VE03_10421 [Pseudogymnoascus sp. 23342-1-I1]|nr:hypothetical protein VE03_10421 [Pseudogymnoascus sp. 23342-1-I1]